VTASALAGARRPQAHCVTKPHERLDSFLGVREAKRKREACEPKAIGSDGKPLQGAAKKSFMAKCEKE
jgi:hypothetical protein